VAVLVDWTVVTSSMVTLLLTTGVIVVVLRAVCVTVIEVVVGVCRQEHTNSTSAVGRERMLENMLALATYIRDRLSLSKRGKGANAKT
jgi:hypothetical protein